MNMMTALIAPPDGRIAAPRTITRALPSGPLAKEYQRQRRLPPTLPILMERIEKAIMLSGTTPTRFGIDARCGKSCIADMRSGRRKPRAKVRLRLIEHADNLIDEARRRAFETLITQFEGDVIEKAVDGLIEMLDARDGDPDFEGPDLSALVALQRSRRAEYRDADFALMTEDDEEDDPVELNGDEQDGNASEDDFMSHSCSGFDPGCPISDPGEVDGDEQDGSYAEWHTLHASQRRSGRIDGKPLDLWQVSLHEDTEHDDRDEGVEDCLHDGDGDEQDGNCAED